MKAKSGVGTLKQRLPRFCCPLAGVELGQHEKIETPAQRSQLVVPRNSTSLIKCCPYLDDFCVHLVSGPSASTNSYISTLAPFFKAGIKLRKIFLQYLSLQL